MTRGGYSQITILQPGGKPSECTLKAMVELRDDDVIDKGGNIHLGAHKSRMILEVLVHLDELSGDSCANLNGTAWNNDTSSSSLSVER